MQSNCPVKRLLFSPAQTHIDYWSQLHSVHEAVVVFVVHLKRPAQFMFQVSPENQVQRRHELQEVDGVVLGNQGKRAWGPAPPPPHWAADPTPLQTLTPLLSKARNILSAYSAASPVGSTPKKRLNSCRKSRPLGHSLTNLLYMSCSAPTSISSLFSVCCVCPMAAVPLPAHRPAPAGRFKQGFGDLVTVFIIGYGIPKMTRGISVAVGLWRN